MYVEYFSNSSGGRWWLRDKDWKALEAAGWTIVWAHLAFEYDEDGEYVRLPNGLPKLVHVNTLPESNFFRRMVDVKGTEYRYMGALARTAYRIGLSLRDAVDEWERVTEGCATDAGCPCCGIPHNFTEYDDEGNYVKSGPSSSCIASFD